MTALDVRFLDRFFDLHVMSPVQHAVSGALTGDSGKSQEALAFSKEKLALAYAWLEGQLAGRTWAAGAEFTLADCAAAPSLFYADWTHRIPEAFPLLRAYRARLLARRFDVANQADPGRDDEGAISHADRQEKPGLQFGHQFRLARAGFEQLHRCHPDADARTERGESDQNGDCKGQISGVRHGKGLGWWD